MFGATSRPKIAPAVAPFAVTVAAIAVTWWWLGAPVALPPSPLAAGQKLYCVSYAPFRGAEDPLVEGTRVSADEIDADLALLSKYADCIRTYSVDDGRDDVLKSARRYGMKVLHGVWISNDPAKTDRQIATTIDLARKFPDVISAIIVGNEVLLRGEMTPSDLIARIREVKAQVSVPVSYADVWEFWLRYRDVQNAVDFVTIHILPYWEDFPLPASLAADHVDSIRKQVAAAFPNKEILIGEVGWPSAGRMREGARPSPSNQARVVADVVALAKRENFRVNIIEAFDQPWKRWLEGTVGGYWGIIDRASAAPKFGFGGAVSDHPHWPMQALAGIALAALTFGAAFAARRNNEPSRLWWKIAALALPAALLFGWTIETVPLESLGAGGWLRSLAFALVAAAAPIVCAAGCAAGQRPPPFAFVLGRASDRRDGLKCALGAVAIALMLLSLQAALGLVFDPRYRDIPFAPQTAAMVPFLVLQFSTPRVAGSRPAAETVAAAALAIAAVYIAINETIANWQALWFSAGLIGLAFTLVRVRNAQG
jgi:exo-beta-1,3-glucanase (GH17 family)